MITKTTRKNKIAGEKASFDDASYVSSGAVVVPTFAGACAASDILTKIRPPSVGELPPLASKTLIGMISPGINVDLFDKLVDQRTTTFALDNVPRMLSRAQSYDVLSSQANIAGYRSVVEAANVFGRFFGPGAGRGRGGTGGDTDGAEHGRDRTGLRR